MPVLYRQVYDRLRGQIVSGELAVGDRLPSETELARLHDVSTMTVKRALEMLRDDGLIVRRPRLGTFVTSSAPEEDEGQNDGLPFIGCILTNFDDTFGTTLLGGLIDAAASRANLVLRRTWGRQEQEQQMILELVRGGAKGLIVEPSSSTWVAPGVLELISRQFPVVIVDRAVDRVPVSTVSSDNVGAGRMLTEHLVAMGHSAIGWVTSTSSVSTVADRFQGFLIAHATSGIPHDERTQYARVGSTIPSPECTLEEDVEGLREYVRDHPELTAFVAAEYNIALLLKEALRREGLGVPEDRSVVCFDHPDLPYDLTAFRFTHVRQDQAAMGRMALERVLEQVDAPHTVGKQTLPMTLVEGASTRSLRRRRPRSGANDA